MSVVVTEKPPFDLAASEAISESIKRSMESIQLGKLITTGHKRDAIHIAVAPVVAAERLAPGQHIGFMPGSEELVRAGETRIGIVDPFLTDWIEKDQQFFMLLYPDTITSLTVRGK